MQNDTGKRIEFTFPRALLKDVLETAIPMTLQDVVLIFITVSGTKQGRLTQHTYAKKIYSRTVNGRQELVVMGGNHLDAYDPATGKRLWYLPDLVGGALTGERRSGKSESERRQGAQG